MWICGRCIKDGLNNASAFGSGAVVTTSNQIIVGNSSVTSIGGFANWSNFSQIEDFILKDVSEIILCSLA